jgi:hypothetical protein
MTISSNPATRRKIAAAFREAARIVAEGDNWTVVWDGACDAIAFATNRKHNYEIEDAAIDAFYDIYQDGSAKHLYWWPRNEGYRSTRVLALLFAAEYMESEL